MEEREGAGTAVEEKKEKKHKTKHKHKDKHKDGVSSKVKHKTQHKRHRSSSLDEDDQVCTHAVGRSFC